MRTVKEIAEDVRTLTRVPSVFIYDKLNELADEILEIRKADREPCEDAVNRQAVIHTVHKSIYEFFDTSGDYGVAPMTDMDKMLLAVNKAICNNVKGLPSVTPIPATCKDCQNWQTEWECSSGEDFHYCPMVDLNTRENFYCADFEKRGSENES